MEIKDRYIVYLSSLFSIFPLCHGDSSKVRSLVRLGVKWTLNASLRTRRDESDNDISEAVYIRRNCVWFFFPAELTNMKYAHSHHTMRVRPYHVCIGPRRDSKRYASINGIPLSFSSLVPPARRRYPTRKNNRGTLLSNRN